MNGRLMVLKYGGRCRACRAQLDAGAVGYYERSAPRGQRVTCPTCHDAGIQQRPAAPSPRKPAPAVPQGDDGAHLTRFESVHAYIDYGMTHTCRSAERERERCQAIAQDTEQGAPWYGLPTLTETLSAIATGWADGAAIITQLARTLDVPTPQSVRRRRVWSDQGDSLDIHRVYCGQLDTAWQRTTRRAVTAARNVKLIASMQGLGALDARVYMWRGAACLALADVLTEAGYNVAIDAEYLAANGHGGPVKIAHRIAIKDYLAPLDVAQLAATLCLAGFKRTYGFAAWFLDADRIAVKGGPSSIPVRERGNDEIAGFDLFGEGLSDDARLRPLAEDAARNALMRINARHVLPLAA